MTLLIVTISIFVFNIPFGYWRANVKKFSTQWFLSIHIPIPFIILSRIYTNLGFQWYTYFFTVSSFFVGQFSGKLIYKAIKERRAELVSSFIFHDIYRYFTC
jgi:hypothetical protein